VHTSTFTHGHCTLHHSLRFTAYFVTHLESLHPSSLTYSHCRLRHSLRVTAHFVTYLESLHTSSLTSSHCTVHTSSFHSQSQHTMFIYVVTTHSVYSLTVSTPFVSPTHPLTITSGCSPTFTPVYTLISIVFLFVPSSTIISLHSSCVCNTVYVFVCVCVCVVCI